MAKVSQTIEQLNCTIDVSCSTATGLRGPSLEYLGLTLSTV